MVQEFRTVRVLVTPQAGFVIKTATSKQGFYTPNIHPTSSSGTTSSFSITSSSLATRVPVPSLLKVFINITYSPSIPAPPTTSVMKLSAEEEEEIIRRAMDGDENSTYFVPLVVSDGREDKDKAGKPSLVFDALLSPTLKSRMTKDFNFKSFVLEIILSHIESPPQTPGTLPTRSLSLSRTLGTPNIRSKGPLEPREVEVPDFGQIQGDNIRTVTNTADIPVTPGLRAASTEFAAKKPLIEEIPPSAKPSAMDTRKPKSILKTEASDHRRQEHEAAAPMLDAHTKTEVDAGLEVPAWRWEDEGLVAGQKLIIETPKLTRPDHAKSRLSLSPDMLTLRTPAYFLQVSLNGDVEVDTAKAEWRVGEGRLVIYM